MTTMETRTLAVPGADLVYDVRGPLSAPGGHRTLLMVGQPMTAEGFGALAAHFTDRAVVTYDPRGLGRSVRTDGRSDHTPQQQAADLHLLVEALGAGPVDVFASSGGAVTALELVASHPGDVATLVAHEPPINAVLPDAEAAERARAGFHEAYQAGGTGAGMAAFIAMTSWQGEFTAAYFAQPAPDPAAFGLPTDDDGSRDDPLLSKASWAITDYRPDAAALTAAPTRILIAVGEETAGTYTARTAVGMAALLGQEAVVFPSHHGGFLGGEHGYAGKPAEFAAKLREVLDAG
ncbi:alpha/beta fold hydrolase [Micromonospora sp. NPDC047670]|uniref:alpha/beta fold hydrolase n=1 Tax=Micromonospora sp. NPDC047670 TaxID=3364252 RepID=UPI00371FD738